MNTHYIHRPTPPDGDTCSGAAAGGRKVTTDWEAMAKELWGLLDDVSAAGDQFKPDRTGYTRAVDSICEKRSQYLYSPDGHTLVPKQK